MQDLRYAARNLWRNRGCAASAILILASGIAASTGLFAVVDAVVLHPLPHAGADRLARVRLLPSPCHGDRAGHRAQDRVG